MITFKMARFGGYLVENTVTGEDILFQLDWDYPSLARTFGWSMAEEDCSHDRTDGTIKCPDCGKDVSSFIFEAIEWLDHNEGLKAEDPGYFG